MIKNALIGHSGFIGNNIKQQMNFTSFYNSKNIFEIKNEEFDLLISCGNSSLKWKANINPIEDQNNIESFIDNIKTIKVKKFVLISTIDVYKNPYNVDENTEADSDDNIPYGKNRLLLEKFIQSNFTNYLIIRLPIVYGNSFKKNLIFDALNNNNIEKINGNTEVQIYNVKNIVSDINKFIKQDLKIVNLATQPFVVKDLFKDVFDIQLTNFDNNYYKYNMTTIHNDKKYFYDKNALLKELKEFKIKYETQCI